MAELISLIYWAFGAVQSGQYSTVAAITFIACDIISNFPEEVAHIWKARWTPIKVLYLIARYYALIFLVITFRLDRERRTVEFCRKYYWFTTFGCGMAYILIINIIFIMRTYAIYERSRIVLVFFCIICAAEFALEFYGSWWSAVQTEKHAMTPPIPQWTGCATMPFEYTGSLYSWVPCLAGSFLFFCASTYKFVQSVKRTPGRWNMNTIKMTSPTFRTFFRDGVFYYLMLTSVVGVATFLSLYKMAVYLLVALPWIYAVFSFSGSHMVLNLRVAGEKARPVSAELPRSTGYLQQYNTSTTIDDKASNSFKEEDAEYWAI